MRDVAEALMPKKIVYPVRTRREDGAFEWRNEKGKLHRDDGPALEFPYVGGTRAWYRNGKRHRDGAPAIEDKYGVCWYHNDKLDREDGPAIETTNGYKYWYRNGQYHRDGGPAIEDPDGNKFWWRHGKRHRDDGPAVELADGTKLWYRDGKHVSESAFTKLKEEEAAAREKKLDQIAQAFHNGLKRKIAVRGPLRLKKRGPAPRER
jgi:hypothetical protein